MTEFKLMNHSVIWTIHCSNVPLSKTCTVPGVIRLKALAVKFVGIVLAVDVKSKQRMFKVLICQDSLEEVSLPFY